LGNRVSALHQEIRRIADFQAETLQDVISRKMLPEPPTTQVDSGTMLVSELVSQIRSELANGSVSAVRLQECAKSLERNARELARSVGLLQGEWITDASHLDHSQQILEKVIHENEAAGRSFEREWSGRFASMQAELAEHRKKLHAHAKGELLNSLSLNEERLSFSSKAKAAEWADSADLRFRSIVDDLGAKYERRIGSLARSAADDVLKIVQSQVKAGHEVLKRGISNELVFSVPAFDAASTFGGELAPAQIKEVLTSSSTRVPTSGMLNRSLHFINEDWGTVEVRKVDQTYVIYLEPVRQVRTEELAKYITQLASVAEAFVDTRMRSAFNALNGRVQQQLEALRGDLANARTASLSQRKSAAASIDAARAIVADLTTQFEDVEALMPSLNADVLKEVSRASNA